MYCICQQYAAPIGSLSREACTCECDGRRVEAERDQTPFRPDDWGDVPTRGVGGGGGAGARGQLPRVAHRLPIAPLLPRCPANRVDRVASHANQQMCAVSRLQRTCSLQLPLTPWTTRSALVSSVTVDAVRTGATLGGLSTLRPRRRSPSSRGAVGEGWATPFEARDRGKEKPTAPVPGHRMPGCRPRVGFRRSHAGGGDLGSGPHRRRGPWPVAGVRALGR